MNLAKKTYNLLLGEEDTTIIKNMINHYKMMIEQDESFSRLEDLAKEFSAFRATFAEDLNSFLQVTLIGYFMHFGESKCGNSFEPFFQAHDCIMSAIVLHFQIQCNYIKYIPDSIVHLDYKQDLAKLEVERLTHNVGSLYSSIT